MRRTRVTVEREYGGVKWPAVQRVIDREREADPDAGLERILGRVAATQWSADDPTEPRPFELQGTPVELQPSGAFGAAQGIVLEYVRQACRETTDLVIEMGPGWGWHLLTCWARGGPSGACYVAAEYTEAGRNAAASLAELAPELDFAPLAFDYHEPSFDGLHRGRHAVVFSAHSVEQIPHIKPELFDVIRDVADSVTCLHFEPVGWQTLGYSGRFSSSAYAEDHDYNRNLIAALQVEEEKGHLAIELTQPDVFGIKPANSTTVVRWRSPA